MNTGAPTLYVFPVIIDFLRIALQSFQKVFSEQLLANKQNRKRIALKSKHKVSTSKHNEEKRKHKTNSRELQRLAEQNG